MANINQVITLGIGTPAGIPEFLTFGLQIGEEVIIPPGNAIIMGPSIEKRLMSPTVEKRLMAPIVKNRSIVARLRK
jgi:hypothetical protein